MLGLGSLTHTVDGLTGGLTHGVTDVTGGLLNAGGGLTGAVVSPALNGLTYNPLHHQPEANGGGGATEINPPPPPTLPDLTQSLGGLNLDILAPITNLLCSLSWTNFVNFIKGLMDTLVPQVKAYIMAQLEPYRDYISNHKILVVFIGIVVAFLLIPIVLFIAFIVLSLGLGLLIFLIVEGGLLFVGGLVTVAAMFGILILALLVGGIVVGVMVVVDQIQEWAQGDPKQPNNLKKD